MVRMYIIDIYIYMYTPYIYIYVSIIVYPLFSIFWGSLSNTIFGSMNGISGICPWNPMGVRHFHRKKCPGSPARFDDAAMLEQGWVPKNGCKGGLNGIIWNFMA
jgi:hypothetical protein